MHAQSTTTAMADAPYPSLPASPTLTNPDMILPYGGYDSTPSPPQHPYEPEDGTWSRNSGPSDMQFSIGPPTVPLGAVNPTTPIIYGNGTMLSDIGEVTEAESTPGRRLPGPAERRMLKQQAQAATARSSPTLGYHGITAKRFKISSHERNTSLESNSTVTSEAPAAELFKDFDDGVSVDDSCFQGDDEESVADSYSEEVIASETQRLSRREGHIGQEEDQNSSAALSRRAEQILLNAKKRLNNMEGNLTRARSTLHIARSSSMSSIHSSSPLAKMSPSPPLLRFVPQRSVPPSKHRQLHTSSDSPSTSPGHSRVYSENSISSVLRTTPFPVRSASAAARYLVEGGIETNQKSSPLSRSPENSRERLLPSPPSNTPPPRSHLEPLTETEATPEFDRDRTNNQSSIDEGRQFESEHAGLTRSTSSMQMRDLRDQMHDLKGRLSVLRDRARDDTMKRRSMQSLRTPSPFTAAEQWYAASKNYGDGGLSADGGVAHSPWTEGETRGSPSDEKVHSTGKTLGAMGNDTFHAPTYAASETSVYEDVSEGLRASSELDRHETQESEEERFDTPGGEIQPEDVDDDIDNDYNDEIVNYDELDEYESDASLYHDTLTTPISHEDREDAFDYEHFFLHSAMGSISQQRHGRRDSVNSFSSDDSVETTRGPTAPSESERPSLSHRRSVSTESTSTIATFATAAEGQGSEDGERGEDDFAVQHVVAAPRSATPVTAKRSTFGSPVKNGLPNDRQLTPEETSRPSSAIRDRDERNGSNNHRPSVGSFDSFSSTGTARSFPLVNKSKSQKSMPPYTPASQQNMSILSESETLIENQGAGGDRMQHSPVYMLAREDQFLVERLVASLGKCVLGLQESGNGTYGSKVWRRRLDAARRTLEGEEGLI